MHSLFFAVALTTTFTLYPGFVSSKSQIEAIRDLGPVLEVIVRCPVGTGIMSYSKVDRQFCTPDWTCYYDMKPAIKKLCN